MIDMLPMTLIMCLWRWDDMWMENECEILILNWCLRNDEMMLWMWDFDIEMMFEKWRNHVMNVRFWYWNNVWEMMKLC
jgi:hypothetical protein